MKKRGLYSATGTRENSPYKTYLPDLQYRSRYASPVGKGGVTGALGQPAEYIARYAWKHYGGTEKTRALGLLAQKEIPIWIKKQILRKYHYNKYYAVPKDEKKKFYDSKNGYSKLQKGARSRTRKPYSKQSNQYFLY